MQSTWTSGTVAADQEREADGCCQTGVVAALDVRLPRAGLPHLERRESAKVASRPTQAGILPVAPATLEEAGLTAVEVEELLLKYLLNRGQASGREMATHVRLQFVLVDPLLRQCKKEQLVVYKGAAPMSDYHYQLTELGAERARRHSERCTYYGAAPVPLGQYVAGVEAQSISKERPRVDDLRRALADLAVDDEMLSQLGQAVSAGKALFLYGNSGNGKTSIAERIARSFGETIWIPRSVVVQGEVIRVYDPTNHEEVPLTASNGSIDRTRIDQRWIRVRRPTIVAGGELTLDNLEIVHCPGTGISEAPLQLKANGGVLVIDDFGRQRISPAELLNRWIVPLEKRFDFLTLHNGLKIQVPFDQLVVFSTNLQPKSLVDEAFLRRIPYKIDVRDPSESEFRQLFQRLARAMGVKLEDDVLDHLILRHYGRGERPMRFCHPRDVLNQVQIFCDFHERPLCATRETVDAAVRNYFAIM